MVRDHLCSRYARTTPPPVTVPRHVKRAAERIDLRSMGYAPAHGDRGTERCSTSGRTATRMTAPGIRNVPEPVTATCLTEPAWRRSHDIADVIQSHCKCDIAGLHHTVTICDTQPRGMCAYGARDAVTTPGQRNVPETNRAAHSPSTDKLTFLHQDHALPHHRHTHRFTTHTHRHRRTTAPQHASTTHRHTARACPSGLISDRRPPPTRAAASVRAVALGVSHPLAHHTRPCCRTRHPLARADALGLAPPQTCRVIVLPATRARRP